MTDTTRRAANIGAIFVVLLFIVIGFTYWFGRGKVRGALRNSLVTDLRNLGVAESLYHTVHHTYTAALSQLTGFSSRNDVTVERADSAGWEARAIDPRTLQTCRFSAGAEGVTCD